jgi:hypothetical protein
MIKTSLIDRRDPVLGINRWLALGAVAGPILFALAYTILGFYVLAIRFSASPSADLGLGHLPQP